MSSITLQLPDQLAAEVARASAEADRPTDEFVVELICRAMAVRRFDEARRRIQEHLGDRAPATDEEAFEMLK